MKIGQAMKIGAGFTAGGCLTVIVLVGGLAMLGKHVESKQQALAQDRAKLHLGMSYQEAEKAMGGVKKQFAPHPENPNNIVVTYNNGVIAGFRGNTLIGIYDPDHPNR